MDDDDDKVDQEEPKGREAHDGIRGTDPALKAPRRRSGLEALGIGYANRAEIASIAAR